MVAPASVLMVGCFLLGSVSGVDDFIQDPQDETVAEGDMAIFTCQPRCCVTCDRDGIHWVTRSINQTSTAVSLTANCTKVTPSSGGYANRYVVYWDNMSKLYTLIIHNVTSDDSLEYFCFVRNGLFGPYGSSHATLTVLEETTHKTPVPEYPLPSPILCKSTPRRPLIGQSVNLTCALQDDSLPTGKQTLTLLTWYSGTHPRWGGSINVSTNGGSYIISKILEIRDNCRRFKCLATLEESKEARCSRIPLKIPARVNQTSDLLEGGEGHFICDTDDKQDSNIYTWQTLNGSDDIKTINTIGRYNISENRFRISPLLGADNETKVRCSVTYTSNCGTTSQWYNIWVQTHTRVTPQALETTSVAVPTSAHESHSTYARESVSKTLRSTGLALLATTYDPNKQTSTPHVKATTKITNTKRTIPTTDLHLNTWQTGVGILGTSVVLLAVILLRTKIQSCHQNADNVPVQVRPPIPTLGRESTVYFNTIESGSKDLELGDDAEIPRRTTEGLSGLIGASSLDNSVYLVRADESQPINHPRVGTVNDVQSEVDLYLIPINRCIRESPL